jgi:HTH-type transcriptional regulator/antitoxin HigA
MENEMTQRVVAEVFHPGEFIKEELEARGWTNVDLAEIMGRHPNQISLIVRGEQDITPETATQLSAAFGTSANVWLNLQNSFDLSQVTSSNEAVAKRAKLYDLFPVREMCKRAWIEWTDQGDLLEKRIRDFFEIPTIEETPKLAHAARKSTPGEANISQLAWFFRCKKLAKGVSANNFTDASLRACQDALYAMRTDAEDVRRVPRVLADYGIRLLIVEALPSTKIDGVCFWLNRKSPVVALSLRNDRIDNFWHTLMHEIAHVRNKDGLNELVTVDTQMFGKDAQDFQTKTDIEQKADSFACEFLVDQEKLDLFISRVRPYYYKAKITNFARLITVHPGLVVGQLQHRGIIDWSHNREMLTKVREMVTQSALTDGWGNTPRI